METLISLDKRIHFNSFVREFKANGFESFGLSQLVPIVEKVMLLSCPRFNRIIQNSIKEQHDKEQIGKFPFICSNIHTMLLRLKMSIRYKNHYDYLEKIAPIFSQKLKEKNPEFKEDLSGFISWRGDTARGHHYSNENTLVEYRKSLIYLMTFAKPYNKITGYKKGVIHQLYLELLPLILECESMV